MTRRGSILLEVLLATAVFAFAGVVILGVLQETVAAGGRAERRALAMDMARTRLAEMEAGLEEDVGGAPVAADPRAGLRVLARMDPSEHEGLALAVVEVFDDARPAPTALAQALGGDANADAPRLAVVRQLVRSGAPGAAPASRAPRPEFAK